MLKGLQKQRFLLLLIVSGIILCPEIQRLSAQHSQPHTDFLNQVLIHLNNVPGGNKSLPGSNGIIELHSGRFRKQANTLDGMASFENVPARENYTVTALNNSRSEAFENAVELWGLWKNVSIDQENYELSFVREMPWVRDVKVAPVRHHDYKPSLAIGDEVVFELFIKNPSSKRLKSVIVIQLKNSDTGNTERLEQEITLEPLEENVRVLLNYRMKEAGEYQLAPGIYVKQGINQWTDCWDWSENAMLYVSAKHRTLRFADYYWDVKSGYANPGNNLWSNEANQVWIDDRDRLNLILQQKKNKWYAAEVISQDTFGYGTYTFYIDTEPAAYDPHVVAGIFLYHDEKNEIDIEFSRWGDTDNYRYGNYVLQPSDAPGNLFQFPVLTSGSYTTHRIVWKPEEILFSSWHGHHEMPPGGEIIAQWQYTGDNIPVNQKLRLHFNIWLFQGIHPGNDRMEKLTINHFTYEPFQ